jgi:hypothetical protein
MGRNTEVAFPSTNGLPNRMAYAILKWYDAQDG